MGRCLVRGMIGRMDHGGDGAADGASLTESEDSWRGLDLESLTF